MRKVVGLVLILALALLASGCGVVVIDNGWNFRNYNGDWTSTYQFTTGRLTVAGANGSITIEVWDKDEVRADARWSAKTESYDFQPVVEEKDGVLSLTLPKDRDLSGVSWVIRVPQGMDVVARTSNGRVDIRGAGFGEVTVNTSNGRVNLDGSGSGLLYVNTSNGSIEIRSWAGEVDASTSNGSITAWLGEITGGRYSLTTSNGAIRVYVEEASAFDLSASTSNGRISADLSGNWSREVSGTNHDGLYNGGGARLILRTSNSNIWLSRP